MRLLRCSADESLDECKRRVGAQRGDSNAGQRDDRDAQRGDRDDDRSGGDRDDDRSGGERDDDRSDGDRDDDRDRQDRGDRDGGGRGDRGRRRRGGDGRDGGGSSFQANKTFGLGLEVGEPTGLTGKYFVSDATALDFGIGWIYRHYYYGDGVHLYGDLLFHPVSLVSSEAFELPFYIGGGLRFWDFDYCDMGLCTYGGSAVGVRIPIGISFDFNNVPLDIFMQLVPVFDFLYGDYYDRYRDRAHAGIDGSVGIRFYFK